jgi:hypothetical protein
LNNKGEPVEQLKTIVTKRISKYHPTRAVEYIERPFKNLLREEGVQ